MINYIIEDWLTEAEIPFSTSPPDPNVGAPGLNNYGNEGEPPEQGKSPNMNIDVGQDNSDESSEENEPKHPYMPDEKKEVSSFENWKKDYFKESIKGNTLKLIELIQQVRDKSGLNAYQKKFIEDNWNIQLLRQNANIEKASNEIRRNMKDQLDRYNPSTSIVSHLISVLETQPNLMNMFIKLGGYGGLKGDIHRKLIAALIGGVQVGSGALNEDIIYNDNDYSILLSTRFNSDWGDIYLGNWTLKTTDPTRYLSESEIKRLDEGSPEEKDVLRRRVILESIASQFKNRSYLFNVLGDDGTVYTVGFDLGGCLKSAYSEGKIVVKTSVNEASEGMITDEGKISSFMDLDIYFTKESITGQDEDGSPVKEEFPFIQKKGSQLFLTADLNTIKDASYNMQSIILKETPYNGNPSDLIVLSRCVFTTSELLARQC